MKKALGYLYLFTTFLLAGIVISSCIINDSEPEDLPVPTIERQNEDEKTYVASFATITNMKCANIFRERSTAPDFSSIDDTKNIGQVEPTNYSNLPSSCVFYDSFTSTGNYYRYRIRYFNGSIYSWTKYTEIVEGLGDGEVSLSPLAGDMFHLMWDDQNEYYLLDLASDTKAETPVSTATKFTELDFLVSNGTVTRPFKLTEMKNGEALSGGQNVDLQKILSTEFLDKKITLEGIVAIQKIEEQNKLYNRYYWSLPLFRETSGDLVIYDRELTENTYTDKNGEQLSIDKNPELFVPSQKSPGNPFIYNNIINVLN